MLRWTHSLDERSNSSDESLNENIPMEIGVKKSFKDERGHIREAVAL